MTDSLITLARVYIEDDTTPYTVTDIIILQKLNAARSYVENYEIYPEDYYYSAISTVYPIGYNYLMNVILKDGNGTIIPDTDYTVDVENGIITFDSSPVVIPDVVYITFNYVNFYEAIAELWLYQAAKSRFSGKAKLGDEDIPIDKNSREYCIKKYWDYRQSKSTQLER